LAFQVSNSSDYLGYRLMLRTGLRLQRLSFANARTSTTSTAYLTVYAGL
jgi:hypothetical protein